MKKTLMMIICGLLAISMAACDSAKTATNGTGSASESTTEASLAEEKKDDTTVEGYTEEVDGYTATVAWCKNGENNIYGEIYYPSDYDESKTYPVVIMSHGVGVTHDFFQSAGWAKYVTDQGYIGYAFDYCGSTKNSLSDMELDEMTIETEISDLESVLGFMKKQKFCDQKNVYIIGQSFGGLVASVTAGRHANEVAGMVLLYPAFNFVDQVHEMFASVDDIPEEGGEILNTQYPKQFFLDIYNLEFEKEISNYKNDILIIHGEGDKTVPIAASQNAVDNIYAKGQAELVTITGEKTMHAFEKLDENLRVQAQEAVGNYLSKMVVQQQEKKVIACVGDSITYGITKNPSDGSIISEANYPQFLGELLGNEYIVLNYGQPGAHTIDDGKMSYWNQPVYQESLESNAEAVIIMLGTNDSAAVWNEELFRADYAKLLDSYCTQFPEAQIYTMTPPCVYVQEDADEVINGIQGSVIEDNIVPCVKEISAEKGVQVIDLHEFTRDHAEWFRDGVHLTDEGYKLIANQIYSEINQSLAK